MSVNWTAIQAELEKGNSSWVNTLNKQQLLAVCEGVGILADDNFTVEHLRKVLQRFVKTKRQDTESVAEIKARSSENNQESSESSEKITEPIPAVKMSFIMCQVEPYNKGKNWPSFRDQLNAFIVLNDVAEEKKAALLLTRLSSQVFTELKAACEPEDLLKMKYKDLREKLETLYEPEQNEYLQRFVFRERKQLAKESIQDYILALKSIAQKCKFSGEDLKKPY